MFLYNSKFLPLKLDDEQQYNLFIQMRKGDYDARQKLVLHNLRFVVHEVLHVFNNTGYEYDELISIGNIGLIRAVETFDVSKNFKFTTYAKRCIDNEILMFLRKNKHRNNNLSLNETAVVFSNGDTLSLEDTICSDCDIMFDYEDRSIEQMIWDIVLRLPPNERDLIIMNYGLFGHEKINQIELANKFNVTQSYISKCIKRILKKIKEELIQIDILENSKNVIGL